MSNKPEKPEDPYSAEEIAQMEVRGGIFINGKQVWFSDGGTIGMTGFGLKPNDNNSRS